MARIRDVIAHTDAPSWLQSVPQNFGEAAAGTMKAAEWRVLATIFLPIALVSLWGEGSAHDSPEDATALRLILDHTMSLFSAVILICYRSTTTRRAQEYLKYVTRYVRDLKIIHKRDDINHKPNHHMAFHLYDFLILFGAVRSWWMFPFERLIGHLQRIPKNHLHGNLFLYCFHLSL